MSHQLPALPEAGAAISADDVQRWENRVVSAVAKQDDMAQLGEWLKQAAALETYMRGKEMQRPMLGASRRIEGRIGQLLGPAAGRGGKEMSDHGHSFDNHQKINFRLLARALANECELTADEWRKSRRALVSLVRQRLGLMPETPPLPDGIYRCIVAAAPA